MREKGDIRISRITIINGGVEMLSKTLRISALIILMFGVLSFFTSCASVTKKFKGGTKENISIFADQTIAMLSEEDMGFTHNQAIYIREYFELDGKEEKAFDGYNQEATQFFKGIIRYSLRLVTIAETEESEQGRIRAYAEYISDWDDDVLESLGLNQDYYANVIAEVRTKETFLDALRTAQPLINAAGRWMNQVMDDLNDASNELAIKIDRMIDEEYMEVILYQEALEEEKYLILKSFGKIYKIYRGDAEAFYELLDLDTIRRKELIPDSSPTEEELGKLTEQTN